MNSIKTLVIVVALAAVAYVVFVSLSGNPEPTPPPGAPEPTDITMKKPDVDLGKVGQESLVVSTAAANTKPGGEAPPFVPGQVTTTSPAPPNPGKALSGPPSPSTTTAPPAVDNAAASPSASAPPTAKTGSTPAPAADGMSEQFHVLMRAAQDQLLKGNYAFVLQQLSAWREAPEWSPAEAQALTELSDQLAGTVIYSREHALEKPYRVRPGDTLQQIAAEYQVPWQLLAKINGIADPERLAPGQELKVLRGPFHARIDLGTQELTLSLQDIYYAGRFPLKADPRSQELAGTYTVQRKTGPTPNAPGAPLTLELEDQVRIEGGGDPNAVVGPVNSPRSLRLSRRDIEDVADILSVGSHVVIRR